MDPAERRWTRRAWRLIAVVLVVRVAYLILAGAVVDLSPDEAYYWDWSRRPDLGYYSKPPLIAWLIGAVTWVGGVHETVLRLPSPFLGTAGLVALFLLARRIGGAAAGLWTVVLAAAAPAAVALNLLLTIDAPALCAWAWALWFLWRALEDDRRNLRWWALAGVATAIGFLSKQTTLALPALTGAWILLQRAEWRRLAEPGVWLFGAVSATGLVPTLVWNARQGWITVDHTASHFGGGGAGLDRHLAWGGEFLAAQTGLYGPPTFVLFVIAVAAVARSWGEAPRAWRFLAWFSAVPLVPVVVLAFVQRVIPNWPAPFLVAALVLAGIWAAGAGSRRRWNRWAVPSALAAGILSAVLLVLPFLLAPRWERDPADGGLVAERRSGVGGNLADALDAPVAKNLRGWEELAGEVERVREVEPRLRGLPVLIEGHRQPLGSLAFYLPDHPRAFRWNGTGVRDSQYEIWPGPETRMGGDFLLLTMEPEPTGALRACFASVTAVDRVEVPLGGRRRHRYFVHLAEGLKSWPPAPGAVSGPE